MARALRERIEVRWLREDGSIRTTSDQLVDSFVTASRVYNALTMALREWFQDPKLEDMEPWGNA